MTVLLRAASHFSFLTGTMPVRELCEEAARNGILHLGLCDWGGLYGLPLFALEAERTGLHALFGVELGSGPSRVTLLARNETGFRSLCRIVSAYRMDGGGEEEGGFLLGLCRRHAEGLWFLCDQASFLGGLLDFLDAEALRIALPPLAGFRRPGEGREEDPRALPPFPEAPRPCRQVDRVPAGPEEIEEEDPASRKVPDPGPPPDRSRLLELSRRHGIPCAAAPWVVYKGPLQRSVHRLAVAVKKGRLFDRVREAELAWPKSFLPTAGELGEAYADLPEALAEAGRVAESCRLSLAKPRSLAFPSAASLLGDPGADEAHAVPILRARAEAGFFRLFEAPRAAGEGAGRIARAQRRLERELSTIAELGFAGYFLVVDEIVSLARGHGIPCLGRGSAADSLVSYCLGFTDADPLRYGLCFERFLNAERFLRGEGDPLPDIDLDFCWRRRDELFDLVRARFGEDRVALLCTQPTLGFRAAYREAARAFGLSLEEVDRRSRGLPRRISGELLEGGREGDFSALNEILQRAPEFRKRLARLPGGPGERLREARIWWGAFGLTGLHRCLGLHPGGTVLGPVPLRDLAPLEYAAKGLPSIQWDKHVAPRMGLVKIDLLGNRGLSVFEDAQRELLRLGAPPEVVESFRETPEEDERASELVRSGRTLGCFQIESPGMRALLLRMEARGLDDLIQALALIRPGPAGCGMMDHFVRRARGEEPVPEMPPELHAVLGSSRGVMLYQEDVILVLSALTGLPPAEADLLRRSLGKDPGAKRRFFGLTRKRSVPRVLAASFWTQIERFAGFSFNKAHSVTYGRLAWRILRVKACQPAALFAALLANDAGYFEKRVYVEEAKRMGVPVLPPCVNRSALRFQAERQGAGGRPALRVGLGEIRELPRSFCGALLADRMDRGPFFSVEDLVDRVEERGLRVEEDWIERLVLAGAFDLLEGTRPEKLWRFRIDFGRRRRRKETYARPGGELFPGALLPRAPVIPCLPELDEEERARLEQELLGYGTGPHPLDPARPEREGGCLPLAEAPGWIGEEVTVEGFLAAQRRHRTRRGEWMCFLTLEDATGMLEAVLFPEAFRRFGGEVGERGSYRLRGRIHSRQGALALHADFLARMES